MDNVKKWILIAVFAGMIGWTLYDTIDWQPDEEEAGGETAEEKGPPPVPEDEIGLGEGEYAPDFTLETLEGEEVSLSDFRGEKKVMLNFWATWCPPCRAEMPDMQNVYEEYEDVEILAVNLTETEPGTDQVAEFRDDFGLTFPILMDHDVSVAGEYDIQPVPTSYLIDTNGQIENIALGPMNEDMMIQIFEQMD
jgi:peroxiredoxin